MRGKSSSRRGFPSPYRAAAVSSALSVGSPSARKPPAPFAPASNVASLHSAPPASSSASAVGSGLNLTSSVSVTGFPAFNASAKSSVCPATSRILTVIRFSVRVPVLSEQITVTDPRVSTAGSLRINALRRSIRCAPSARVMVTTAGNPSGTAATAIAIAVKNSSFRSSPRSNPRTKTTPTMATAATASPFPSCAIRF